MTKRIFDILASATGLILLSPLLFLVSILVYFKLGSPILFRQVRPGLACRPFELYKFRSMRDSTDEDGNLLPDSERLTSFGRLLRSTSLDELPSLWNVMIGDMSLVGPRPLLMEYVELYSDHQMRRHDVRPGITGWAQINGRNAIEWAEKFDLDVWYVENRTFLLDMKIIVLTLLRVVRREGISSKGNVTMHKFEGNK